MKLTGKESFLEPPPTNGNTLTPERVEVLPFVVAIDTREQLPFPFHGLQRRSESAILQVTTRRQTLKTGDYSLCGLENFVVVERKSKADLFGSVSSGRERFKREMQRMAQIPRCCVVVEASMEDIKAGLDNSRMDPLCVVLTAVSWAGRWRIPWFFCQNRAEAEAVTLDFLRFAWEEFTGMANRTVLEIQRREITHEENE